MFIGVQVSEDIRENGKKFVTKWWTTVKKPVSAEIPSDVRYILAKVIPSDFYKDPKRYYVMDDGRLRKNPHRYIQ